MLSRLIGDCNGKKILDLGCGNGYLARKYAREGAAVTADDSSFRMIEHAQARDPKNTLKINYIKSDASRLDAISDASYDLIFANMSLMNIEDTEGAIKEVSRVLRGGGGRFVASICHPCFDNGTNSGWMIKKISGEPRKFFRKIRV